VHTCIHLNPDDSAAGAGLQRAGRARVPRARPACFGGILAGLLASTLDKTQLGFEQMNSALKLRVEARAEVAS
jgi:hypothetical protein